MGVRQRKVERRRQKSRARKRTRDVLGLRSEQRMRNDAHPLHACVVNRYWQEEGMASIVVARRVGARRVTMAAFLVDRLAMGLKDAWGRVDISGSEFDELTSRLDDQLETCPLNLGTAKHLVYGGIQLARELGFRLPRRYERWTAILGPLPEGESPDMSLFLDDGKIRLMCSERDLGARLIGTTPERFLARPDVDFTIGGGGFTLMDDEEDEIDDLMDRLQQAMTERAQQWCFANGQTPHPLLPDVVGASLEAIMQTAPPDLDLEQEVEALSDEQQDHMTERMLSFLSASFHHDPVALGGAITQFQAFMGSVRSPQELFELLPLEDE